MKRSVRDLEMSLSAHDAGRRTVQEQTAEELSKWKCCVLADEKVDEITILITYEIDMTILRVC